VATRRQTGIGVVTPADVIATAERDIDTLIDRYLVALERKIRLDIAATGPEDDAALDRPPDPGSPWGRITPEEIIIAERATLMAWRDQAIATVRVRFAQLFAKSTPGRGSMAANNSRIEAGCTDAETSAQP
jgi:hypothetical protein